MSKLSLNNPVVNTPDPNKKEESVQPKKSREWKPSVRIKERKPAFRQKLSISDLYPDRNYIKDVTNNEGRYFILLIIPVVVTALYNAVSRQDLYNRLVAFFVEFFGS